MHIAYSDLTPRQLDWCIAKILGRALRMPRRASNEDVQGLQVPFQMFETVETIVDGKTTHRVSPITVTRYGRIWSGATGDTISFVGADGRDGTGTVNLFYLDEKEAELEALGGNRGFLKGFHPSTNQADGVPVRDFIDGGLELKRWRQPEVAWSCQIDAEGRSAVAVGTTELLAFARAMVRGHLGDTVDVPTDID